MEALPDEVVAPSKISLSEGRGKKWCPHCKNFIGPRSKTCKLCGSDVLPKQAIVTAAILSALKKGKVLKDIVGHVLGVIPTATVPEMRKILATMQADGRVTLRGTKYYKARKRNVKR